MSESLNNQNATVISQSMPVGTKLLSYSGRQDEKIEEVVVLERNKKMSVSSDNRFDRPNQLDNSSQSSKASARRNTIEQTQARFFQASKQVEANIQKYGRVPYFSKIIEDDEEKRKIKTKLRNYLILDLTIVALSLVMYFTNPPLVFLKLNIAKSQWGDPKDKSQVTSNCDYEVNLTPKQINAPKGECHAFAPFILSVIIASSVSVLFDLFSLYQISKSYINAVAQVLTLLIDVCMFGLAIWDIRETVWAIMTFNDTKLMFEQIVCFFLMIARVVHIPVLLFLCFCCVPCQFFSDQCCVKRWLNKNQDLIDPGIEEEIDKQKWRYNSKKDLETFQKLHQLKHKAKKMSLEAEKPEPLETDASVDGFAVLDKDRPYRRMTHTENEPVCYICTEEFREGDDLVFLPCKVALIEEKNVTSAVDSMLMEQDGIDLSHIFHCDCLKASLHQLKRCFICRAPVTKKTFQKFYNYNEFRTFLNSSNQLRELQSIITKDPILKGVHQKTEKKTQVKNAAVLFEV